MLNKCANPVCLRPFRKLSQGKLFLVEMDVPEGAVTRRANWRGQPPSRIEYYWLCDECAFGLTLSYESGRGMITVPRREVAKKMPAAAVHARKITSNESGRQEQST